MKILATIILAFTLITCYGQSKDTIVDGVYYNHIEFDKNDSLLILGNYNDKGQKHGHWIHFSRPYQGYEGDYVKGSKTGLWKETSNKTGVVCTGSYSKGRKDGCWVCGEYIWRYERGKSKGAVQRE
jgi:hypothetical protein